jgi:hypothetical protein
MYALIMATSCLYLSCASWCLRAAAAGGGDTAALMVIGGMLEEPELEWAVESSM